MEQLFIQGRVGMLEAQLDLPADSTCCAVLCHPHPLYGGNMHDHVVSILVSSLLASGVGCLRFNFRGVGASEGEHDHGEGEVDDVLAAAVWLKQERGISRLILCGYSFGAVVVMDTLDKVDATSLILVAPPVGMMKSEKEPQVPALVILGELDDIVDEQSTKIFFAHAEVKTIAGSNHFFSSAESEIELNVREFVDAT